jgi:hypothetical protein
MADFSGVLSVPHIGRGRSVEPLSTWLLKSSKARVMGGPWTGGRWASSSLRCFQGECTPTSLGSAIPLLPLTHSYNDRSRMSVAIFKGLDSLN